MLSMVRYLLTNQLWKKKWAKKTTISMFLKRVTPSQEEPRAGLLGGVPEEGIAVTEHCPWSLPLGQDMKVDDSDIDDPDPVQA